VWGDSRLTTVPAAAKSGVTAIAAVSRNIALKNDGSVVSWGSTAYGVHKTPAGLPPVFAIAAGDYLTVVLVRDPAPSLTLFRNADQTLSLSWTGAGALEQTESLTTASWQLAPSQANPQSVITVGETKFYRVKAE
jgi:hypothetical protein